MRFPHGRVNASDEIIVSRFLNTAAEILDAAVAAHRTGAVTQEMTVLIASDGGISLVAESDWPLDALKRERGAALAYRVGSCGERLVVEGRAGAQACLLAAAKPDRAARTLLHSHLPFLPPQNLLPDNVI